MSCTACRAGIPTVHPHGRGDNDTAATAAKNRRGSPPRAWGQYECHHAGRDEHRFTPTGVGTMRRCGRSRHLVTVHPHGRGDNCPSYLHRLARAGSPPRAWGQSTRLCLLPPVSRFTPTGVGTMRRVAGAQFRPAVHPHGRGDNHHTRVRSPPSVGSPPRAWGQYRVNERLLSLYRFTPTGVGTIC